MMETASLVASVELVITVDTMIAHLAGALGRPTWVLLKADPDWRWSAGRESFWYPSARLYRQSRARDWSSVIAEIEADLAGWARAGSATAPCRALVEREQACA
jgi:ADP-heptose:LPS heptosyltransferase